MAHPVPFKGMTHDFGPPPGLDEMVGRLPCFMNGASVTSAWQLDPQELQQVIDSGGIVFMNVMSGVQVFPVYVGSEQSCKEVVSDTGKVW